MEVIWCSETLVLYHTTIRL